MNFSKKGMEGVLGVAGRGTFGGSLAGGIVRSRRVRLPSSGDGVRVSAGVIPFEPSRGGSIGPEVYRGD